jgi:hypothetical protein
MIKDIFKDFGNEKNIDSNVENIFSALKEDENDYINSFKRGNNYNEDFSNSQNNKDNLFSNTIKVNEVLKDIREDSSDDEKENNSNKIDFIEEENNLRKNRHLNLFETRKNKK